MDLFPPDRLPLVPEALLKAHKVYSPNDSRFRACARLLQALHREAAGWTMGSHVNPRGQKRKMGHLLATYEGAAGGNFLSPEVHRLARRELAYREPGAVWDETRLYSNMLSSTPMALNLFGPIKLDRDLAEAFVREIAPDLAGRVCAVTFEHSPGRGDPHFLADGTAFDVAISIRQDDGKRTFIGVETKYSETCAEAEPRMRERYDDLARESDLFIDADDPALRRNPVQQCWRLHLLGQAMVACGLYDAARIFVVAPRLNDQVQRAVSQYREHLASAGSGQASFANLPLEDAIAALALAGAPDHAVALTKRYIDMTPVHQLI